jgi:hypothetical protein
MRQHKLEKFAVSELVFPNFYGGYTYQLFICNKLQSYSISTYSNGFLDKLVHYIDGEKDGLYISTYEWTNRVYSVQYFKKNVQIKIMFCQNIYLKYEYTKTYLIKLT